MAVGQFTHLVTDAVDTVKSASDLPVPDDGSVLAGDLLVWFMTIDSGSETRSFAVTGISGFTALPDVVNGAGHRSAVWYKIADLGDLGETITVTSLQDGSPGPLRRVAALGKISGVDPTNPLGSPAKYSGVNQGDGGASTKTAPSVSSIGSNCREIHLVIDNQNGAGHTTNWTAPSGFTRRGQGNTPSEVSQNCSFAWGDSDALVSGTATGGTWTANDAAIGAAWTLVAHPEVTGTDYENDFEESEGLTDSLSTTSAQSDTLEESEALTDTLNLSQTLPEGVGETLGLTDSLDLALTNLSTLPVSDGVGLTDSLSLQLSSPPADLGLSTSLVQGPAELYIGAFGAIEPNGVNIWETPDSGVWTPVGGTRAGLELTVENEYKTVEFTQLADTPIRRLMRRKLTVKTSLAEPTLQNLLYVLNSGEIVEGSGYREYLAPPEVNVATPLEYRAVLIYGWAPGRNLNGSPRRRVIVLRKCVSTEGTQLTYSKDNQSVLTVSWSVHYVDSTTPPFKVIDSA